MVDVPQLAARLHAGQVDKGGRPYVEHLQAVVAILLRRWPDAPQHVVDAAWLHDALEDVPAFWDKIRGANVSEETIGLVYTLTRMGRSYHGYIYAIANSCAYGEPWAIRIKLADLEHNSDPARAIPGSDIVAKRYAPAREILEAAERARAAGIAVVQVGRE